MAVPDSQSFFKPLLDIAADGREYSMAENQSGQIPEMIYAKTRSA